MHCKGKGYVAQESVLDNEHLHQKRRRYKKESITMLHHEAKNKVNYVIFAWNLTFPWLLSKMQIFPASWWISLTFPNITFSPWLFRDQWQPCRGHSDSYISLLYGQESSTKDHNICRIPKLLWPKSVASKTNC